MNPSEEQINQALAIRRALQQAEDMSNALESADPNVLSAIAAFILDTQYETQLDSFNAIKAILNEHAYAQLLPILEVESEGRDSYPNHIGTIIRSIQRLLIDKGIITTNQISDKVRAVRARISNRLWENPVYKSMMLERIRGTLGAKLSDDQIAQLRNLIDANQTITDISKAIGATSYVVRQYIENLGITYQGLDVSAGSRARWKFQRTPQTLALMVNLVEEGLSTSEIAANFGDEFSVNLIRLVLTEIAEGMYEVWGLSLDYSILIENGKRALKETGRAKLIDIEDPEIRAGFLELYTHNSFGEMANSYGVGKSTIRRTLDRIIEAYPDEIPDRIYLAPGEKPSGWEEAMLIYVTDRSQRSKIKDWALGFGIADSTFGSWLQQFVEDNQLEAEWAESNKAFINIEDTNAIIGLLTEGYTLDEIEKMYELRPNYLGYRLRRLGIEPNDYKPDISIVLDEQWIADLFTNNLTQLNIRKVLLRLKTQGDEYNNRLSLIQRRVIGSIGRETIKEYYTRNIEQ